FDFPAREYNPRQGRWISPDPAGLSAVSLGNPQTWNRYAYVGNNPLLNTDPTGLLGVDDPVDPSGAPGDATGEAEFFTELVSQFEVRFSSGRGADLFTFSVDLTFNAGALPASNGLESLDISGSGTVSASQ